MSVATALAWAHTQVGVTENPPGSNQVVYWQDYDNFYGVHDDGLSWCGAFSWAVLRHGGWQPPALWIGVQAIEDWGRTHGRYRDGYQGMQPGDQVILIGHGVHTGVCRAAPTSAGVATVEGNTSPSPSSPDQDYNGGVVAEKVRPFSDVIGYVAVHDLLPADPAPQPQQLPAWLVAAASGDEMPAKTYQVPGQAAVWVVSPYGVKWHVPDSGTLARLRSDGLVINAAPEPCPASYLDHFVTVPAP